METWTEFVMLQLGRFNSSVLKQTTVTRTKQKRKKNKTQWAEQKPARVFYSFVQFSAVLCKTTAWNHHSLRRFANGNHEDKLFLISIWNSKLRNA